MSGLARQRLMFAVLCLVWGSTWIAMKQGTVHVPPALFAGLRWTVAGAILLMFAWFAEGRLRIPWHALRPVLVISVLLNSANQLFMLYGLRYVGSGLGAVINCALTPLALLGFAVATRQERITGRVMAAMALGVIGIFVLFGPAAVSGRLDGMALFGASCIVMGTLTYAAGSVLARPLTQSMSPYLLSGIINLLGGLELLPVSLIFEPGSFAALDLHWGFVSWVSWFFLVAPASLGASTIFLILVRDWGASKAGSFAFISPIVAVFEGLMLSGEALHPVDAVGMALMLVAAWVALRKA
jgi:drug/metabolite transporter (DMT)-like permease